MNCSKAYLLLSKYEGGNRAMRQAMLCDIPVIGIKGSQPAESNISEKSGIAADDNPQAIARAIIEIIDCPNNRFEPRRWALKLNRDWRMRLWEAANSIQRFPGYPDIEKANEIRKRFTEKEGDNYIDLNNAGESMPLSVFEEEIKNIRDKFLKIA